MIPYAERLRRLQTQPEGAAGPDVARAERLGALVAEVLGLPGTGLDPERSFADLGLSSLLALRLVDRINRAFGLRLGIDVLFTHANLRQLDQHLAGMLPHGPPAPTPNTSASPELPAHAVAVIGYSGRFAGADSPAALWQALTEGRSLLSPMPPFRRLDSAGPGPRAGFLADAERFDAAFFGVSNREAAAMDPVQRLFLEQAWCALEHAGLTRERLAGRSVGVYAGAAGSGHERLVPVTGKAADAYVMTGSLASMTAARIAYFLDLGGPALTLDTACSSSLMAVHLAAQALAQGDAEIAIAGGASLFLDERPFQAMQRAGMLSPSAGCRPFDDDADGIAVAEAAACVVLKPLAAALADGDRIDAVIRASAANQDGRSNGITAPNAAAQARLLRSALERAGVEPGSVDLIETHGTGTPLGDPVEAAALREVFTPRPDGLPLRLGAIKGCTGHASEAAGVTGLVATLLALGHRTLPPVAGFTRPNRHLSEGLPADAPPMLDIAAQARPWERPEDHPRRAGVSAFGLSGTNVHLILEEAPSVSPAAAEPPQGPLPFLLSAATAEDLQRRRAQLAAWLAGPGGATHPGDLARTLMRHREPMAFRWAALARDLDELRTALAATGPTPVPADPRLQRWLAGDPPGADWLEVPPGPPLDLPPYPFHGPRLWGGRTLPEGPDQEDPPGVAHPLLGEPRPDGGYLRRFLPDEPLIAGHRVAGQPMLSAALLIEMALAAAHRAHPAPALAELGWLRPIRVSDPDGTPVITRLETGDRGDAVVVNVGNQEHFRCRVDTAQAAPGEAGRIDPEALWQTLADLPRDIGDGTELERLRGDRDQALGWLPQAPVHAGHELSARLLDAAIQIAAVAAAQAETRGLRLRLPARMEGLRVSGPIPSAGLWLHARRRAGGPARHLEQVDVRALDHAGRSVLTLEGLSLAAAAEGQSARAAVPDTATALDWRLVWTDLTADTAGCAEHTADLVVSGLGSDPLVPLLLARAPGARLIALDGQAPEALMAEAVAGLPPRAQIWFLDTSPQHPGRGGFGRTLGLLALLRSLADAGRQGDPLVLRVVTAGAMPAQAEDEVPHPLGACVLGLAKAASREFPAWQFRLMDLAAGAALDPALVERLRQEPGCPLGEPVALRGARRLAPRLGTLDDGPMARSGPPPVIVPEGGHVIIIGGTGRLGGALARHYARNRGARISLIGRAREDTRRAQLVRELAALGGSARYFRADLTDPEALGSALDQALEAFGPAALLVQSVVDPSFARVERSRTGEFAAALAPKVTGLAHLGEALSARDVAALAVFSSIGAFTGFPANDGQASYCAACGFEGSYGTALARSLRRPVRVIHWGLWDTGDVPPEATRQMAAGGLYAMDPADLGRTLEHLLRAPFQTLVHARLGASAWEDMGAPEAVWDGGSGTAAGAARSAIEALDAKAEPIDPRIADVLSAEACAGLVQALDARGMKPGRALTDAEACAILATLPRHRPLARALLRMAERHGLIRREGGTLHCQAPPVRSADRAAVADLPGAQGALGLLAHCVEALPRVLAGEQPGTDVLFPAGSMALVDDLYRGHPVLAGCGRLVAEGARAVVAAIAEGGGRARILEIGAGTGATTGPVLAALEATGLTGRFGYCYSDISQAFVRHGRSHFGARIESARVLDIARPPETQGMEPGAWDLVIASDVLHATADIRLTLAHTAALLGSGGVLLVNETVAADDFATLSFGLLDGWWAATDPECRLPDGPVLSLPGWQAALRRAGLQGRLAYAHDGTRGAPRGGHAVLLASRPAPTARPEPVSADATKATASPSSAATAASSGATQEGLEALLRERLAAILDIPGEAIERERPFTELGVDSLIAPQIAEDLEAALGCPLRTTDVYAHGHLSALADHLLTTQGDHLRLADTDPEPTPTATTSGAATPVPEPAPAHDTIAIIGLSVRLPGAPDLDALWDLLAAGRSAITPLDRFDLEPWYDPKGGPGRSYARWGGFLPDHDRFDPYFFNITPAEAEVMDPQQRVLMEETWKAIEHAGLDPAALSGSRCGLFVGASANNYDAPGSPGLRTLGNSMAILSARMAYVLNLRGPTFPVDTGCSSSLVALHQACQSLRSGECDIALAGGVSVNLIRPEIFLYLSDTGMASPTGRCHSFDDRADGFVPGEGAGVVVLKRLRDALTAGDRIDAVIAGSGVNQDGRTAGLTAPSADAQTALELDVYRRFGLDPASFGMVEAHGTGTPLGDPIEVQALSTAFRPYTDRTGGCAIGSIKTNLGHTMAAAGIAGLAKTVLALAHRVVPASLNFATPNRHFALGQTPFFVPCEATPWPEGRALRAAVSSFGFSGTNAHAVVEAAPVRPEPLPGPPGPWAFMLSARDPEALRRRLRDLAQWLRAQATAPDLARVAETLGRGRAHWRHRLGLVAASLPELLQRLDAGAEAPLPPAVTADHIAARMTAPGLPALEAARHLVRAYEAGDLPDWDACFGPRRPPLALPPYPFSRERFWNLAPAAGGTPAPATDRPHRVGPDHPLLRAHRVGGRPILPGTLMLELLRGDAPGLTDVRWLRPWSGGDGEVELRVAAGPGADSLSLQGDGAAPLATARRWPGLGPAPAAPERASPGPRLQRDEIYRRFSGSGFDYGEALQVLDWVEVGPGRATAGLTPSIGLAGQPLLQGAALLDGALQAAAAIGFAETARDAGGGQWVPRRLGALRVWQRPRGPLRVDARLQAGDGPGSLRFRVEVRTEDGQAVACLEDLEARRLGAARPLTETYRPVWRQASGPELPAPACIAISAPNQALEQPLRERYPAAQWTPLDRASGPEALAARLRDLPRPLVLLHLFPCAGDDPAEDPVTVATGLAALDPLPALRQALSLVQAVLQGGRADGVTLISAGAGEGARLAGHALSGLYRTLAREAPALAARAVLADSRPSLPLVLARELTAGDAGDPLVRHRGGSRERMDWDPDPGPPVPGSLPGGEGTVLISGGLGGIGLALARHLADQGATRLALLGRSPAGPAALPVLRELESRGLTVLTLTADVGDAPALRQALESARDVLGPITAVYHLAGRLEDAFLLNKTTEELADVVSAKARGAILLDLLTRDDPLQGMVLFGSTAAVLGAIGQGDYAAANAFLEAFSEHREAQRRAGRRRGRTLCVHWPLWAEGGMQPPADAVAALATVGMAPLPSAGGFAALAGLWAGDRDRALVLHGSPGLLSRLRRRNEATATDPTLQGAGERPQPDQALAYLHRILGEVTKLPPERIQPDTPFEELGIDSIMVMSLNARLEQDLGPVAKTLFFEFRTPGALAAHLAETLARVLTARLAADDPPAPRESAQARSPDLVTEPLRTEPREPGGPEPIAIIGVAGLYPDAPDLDAYWRNLRAGRDCIREIPAERWPLDGFFDPDRDNPATCHTKWGGFIADADCFDARFFGIAPLEAETLDPQARKFLEIAWNALEDAGLPPQRMFDGLPEAQRARRACGVYVGVMYGDYQLLGPEEAQHGNLIGPNADYWNIANRVSAFLDLHGPSMAVDTACSSSLTAIHLACQAIRAGDCALAIAGGVNLCLHPRRHWILSKAGMASSDGRCRSFGAGGDGYVPGEGIGAVVLKPLHQALRDGDRVQAVILGSAANHGGHTSGYTVPSPVAQGDVVAAALERAGVDPRSVTYLEAHGTGTPLGDPIEIRGLLRAFEGREPGRCAIGSVKANIGHLESAAGIAGLTKVLLQMRHRTLVPTPHADRPNPDLDLGGTPFRIQTGIAPWEPAAGVPLRAGISSFGAGGANVHLVLEAGPDSRESARDPGGTRAFLLSAHDQEALRRRAGQLAEHLSGETGGGQSLADVAYTLAWGRAPLGQRLAVLADSASALIQALAGFAETGQAQPPELLTGRAPKRPDPVAADIWADPRAAARAWVAGAVPPAPLDPGTRRVALPGYPFASRRLWVRLSGRTRPTMPPQGGETRTFRADGPPVLDHHIAGRLLVPGASSLLLALNAAAGRGLAKIVWPEAGVVSEGGTLTLTATRQGPRVQVTDGDGRRLLQALVTEPAMEGLPPADADAVAAACPQRLDGAEAYAALARADAHYGPSLQALVEVRRGDGMALAQLRPGLAPDAVLDAAFQLSFALIPETLAGRALLPAGLERLAMVGDLDAAHTLVARLEAADTRGITLDLQLLDSGGRRVAWLEGLRVQAPGPEAEPAEPPPALFRPDWAAIAAGPGDQRPARALILSETPEDRVAAVLSQAWNAPVRTLEAPPGAGDPDTDLVTLVLGDDSPDLEAAAHRAERILARLLALLPGWAVRERPPRLLLLTRAAHADLAGPASLQAGAGSAATAAAAFIRAAAREREGWPAVCLDLPEACWDPATPATTLLDLVARGAPPPGRDPVPRERAWRDGVLLQRVLTPLSLPQPAACQWRDGDVLLVAGGGGLGGLLALHAAARADLSVALMGRRAEPGPATAEALNRLTALGRRALYLQADLGRADQVGAAVANACAELGPVTWVVHTAMVMGDAPLRQLDRATLDAVLAPKTRGLANLARAAGGLSLRGFLVFSSSNALTANPGQAAYAAASAFIDDGALGLARARPWPVWVLDWGYWGETGAVADAGVQANLGRLGVLPIRDREGLDALDRVLAQAIPRTAVLRVEDRLLTPLGVNPERAIEARTATAGDPPPDLGAIATAAAGTLTAATTPFPDPELEALNGYAARRLLVALARLGLATRPGEALDPESLARGLGARADYRPLLGACTEILHQAGLADPRGRATEATGAVDTQTLEREREALVQSAPAAVPTLGLMDACLDALGEVAAGRREAAAVLFPGGDPSAVEAIYRGNPVVDHFQALTAAAVRAAAARLLQARPPGETVEILEVGAGTGATSGFVLEALSGVETEQPGRLRYRLTDLAGSLAADTTARLSARHPYVRAGRLDVTRPLGTQQVAPSTVDLIIAANVLHATEDLLQVLGNLKEALRPGGLLVLNEATSGQAVNTVTFGLTPGWWAFRDGERRLPNGPLLDPPRWSRLLAEAGYTVAGRFGLPLEGGRQHPLQSVILATADAFAPDRTRDAVPQVDASPPSRPAAALKPAPAQGADPGPTEQALRLLVAETLRLEPEELGLDDSFSEHGADSILSVELVRRINAGFGIDLKSTALFNYATVRELARYMRDEHGVGAAPAAGADEQVRPAAPARQRSQRLLEVINRRREALPVNREAEFWQREATPAAVSPVTEPATPPPIGLDQVLERLERGEISVAEAMELQHVEP